jgi:hypothetical protein
VNIKSNTGLAAEKSGGSLGEALFRFPTTIAHQALWALWYLDRLHAGDPAWNIAVRFRLRGPLDVSIHNALSTSARCAESHPAH